MSRNRLELTGQRFGKLVALKCIANEEGKGMMWFCKCDCGKYACFPGARLNSALVVSCGCLRKVQKDWTGQRFARLLVMKDVGSSGHYGRLWLCKCDCGNLVEIPTSFLPRRKSCGCAKREAAEKFFESRRDFYKFQTQAIAKLK